MTQGHNSFLHYSTGYKHLAGMIRREINSILTRTVLCAWSGTLQGRLLRRDNASCCYPFASFRFSRFASESVKTAAYSARHAAICWRFEEPQSASVVAHLSIRLLELGAKGAYRVSPSQVYKQTALRANKLGDEQSIGISELFL
jgi:hypothetical protein